MSKKSAKKEAIVETQNVNPQGKKIADPNHTKMWNTLFEKHNGVKSKVIREMSTKGIARADIARAGKIIYQHVRNVLEMPLKSSSK